MKRNRLIKNFFGVTVLSTALLLGACSKQLPRPQFTPYRPINQYQRSLMSKMKTAGIKVIKLGDYLKIVIPTDKFFVLQTTKIKPQKVKALLDTARFVRNYASEYAHPTIEVNGYTDTVFARKTRRTLSRQYAEVIASYLWSQGVNRNRLSIHGYGAQYPIGSNLYTAGAAYNRRVEIVIDF